MTIYLLQLKDAMRYALIFLLPVILGIYILVIFIIIIVNIKKNKLKKLRMILLIANFLFAISLISYTISGMGITTYKIYNDYKASSFSYYEGEITDVTYSKDLSKGNITINNTDFIGSMKLQSILRREIGSECEIAFGTKSKYIVDYRIVDK